MRSKKTPQTESQAFSGKHDKLLTPPQDSRLEEDIAFQELFGDHLMKWDASITPPIPALDDLEQLVTDHKQQLSRRLWRDLLLLWVIGGLVISGMLLLLQHNIVVFALVQIGAIAAAAIFLMIAVRSSSKEGRHKWTN
ncbi:DUF5345 family protein [Paenibacillus solisilvae]|uniref:DUF5345 family protein n=1 Tax=Paenibacillus solisilvae TaxID=2486751 RepID=A0ABW0VTB9_9BACL